jgi:hypothetical protein
MRTCSEQPPCASVCRELRRRVHQGCQRRRANAASRWRQQQAVQTEGPEAHSSGHACGHACGRSLPHAAGVDARAWLRLAGEETCAGVARRGCASVGVARPWPWSVSVAVAWLRVSAAGWCGADARSRSLVRRAVAWRVRARRPVGVNAVGWRHGGACACAVRGWCGRRRKVKLQQALQPNCHPRTCIGAQLCSAKHRLRRLTSAWRCRRAVTHAHVHWRTAAHSNAQLPRVTVLEQAQAGSRHESVIRERRAQG